MIVVKDATYKNCEKKARKNFILVGKSCLFNCDDLISSSHFSYMKIHKLVISYFITATQIARQPLSRLNQHYP